MSYKPELLTWVICLKYQCELYAWIWEILKIYHLEMPKGIWGISQMPGYLGISQMTVYLGNFLHDSVSVKFLKYPGIWEISKILKIYHPQIPIRIWGISQMPGYLGNFTNALVSVKFLKHPGIWEISKILKIYHPQMPGYLINFPNDWVSVKFLEYPALTPLTNCPNPPHEINPNCRDVWRSV